MDKLLKCISPTDGSVYAERQVSSYDDACTLVARARGAQKNWAMRPLAERIRLVQAGVARLTADADATTQELAMMMGRPVRYGGEFGGVVERADYMAQAAENALMPLVAETSDNFERCIRRVPHGVVLVVAPWNYPYLTAINTIVPALIAGNAVLLKHATQTLLAGERLVNAFCQAGVPSDIFQNIFLTHDVTSQLIATRQFNFVNFTGSVAGGQEIEKAAAGTFTTLGLELGGKDPGYVADDADVVAAANTLTDAAMFNSGQCCCGIERIYVCEQHYDDLLSRMVALIKQYRLGNPLALETTLGPMANKRFALHVRTQIAQAIEGGAVAHINTMPNDDGEGYLTPQLLTNVNHEMRIMREESFGPVVCLMKVKDDDEALARMNDSDYGLTVSLWTQDTARATRLGEQLETGTVFMNRADYLDPALCWTGCKNTGRGGSLSVIGFHNLTRPQSYHFKKYTK